MTFEHEKLVESFIHQYSKPWRK